MIRRKLFALTAGLACLAVLIFSCSKDLSSESGTIPTVVTITPTSPGLLTITLPSTPITLSVSGRVIDENNNPVSGAGVSGGGKSTVTDTKGIFRITNGNFNGSFATVTIVKTNYFTLVKTFTAQHNATQYLTAKLSPFTLAGTVPVTGGSISAAGGSLNVSFPANAFTDVSGSAVTGNVFVYLTYIDPTAVDSYLRMPGNLTGITAPSALSLLTSYGMFSAELRNSAGQKVNLAPGKYASITAQIPAASLATAPATIPFWYFDETGGVWVKQGEATKVGNTYKGDVGHFTFWNLDVSNSYAYFAAQFKKRADSSFLPYAHISFLVAGSANIYNEYTDAVGYTNGLVPYGTQVRMKLYHADGTILLDTLIGPYTSATDLGSIYVNYPALTTPVFTGVLMNCNGAPAIHGSIIAVIDSLDFHAIISPSGQFTLPVTTTVSPSAVIHITGYDSTTNTPITPINYTYTGNNNIILGNLYACATTPGEYINYTLDGVAHNFIRNTDSAFCTATFAFNRTNIACRRSNGSPTVEGYVAFITGPTTTGGSDTSSVLTAEHYSSVSTPPALPSLNIISFTENYTQYPASLSVPGWVTGNFNVVFKDTGVVVHTLTSQFHMWRN